MKPLLYLLAFLLEVVAFVGVAAYGFALGGGVVVHVLVAVVLVVLLAAFWGRWLAPRAERRLVAPRYHVAKTAIFVVAAGGILLTWDAVWAVALLVVYAADEALIWPGTPAQR